MKTATSLSDLLEIGQQHGLDHAGRTLVHDALVAEGHPLSGHFRAIAASFAWNELMPAENVSAFAAILGQAGDRQPGDRTTLTRQRAGEHVDSFDAVSAGMSAAGLAIAPTATRAAASDPTDRAAAELLAKGDYEGARRVSPHLAATFATAGALKGYYIATSGGGKVANHDPEFHDRFC